MTEAETYLDAVRAALSDLPAAERDDLLEDLPGHLAETLAETGGPLEARLGTPQAYAAELRASAGLPAASAPRSRRDPVEAAFVSVADATGRQLVRLREVVLGLPYGPQLLAFLPELRPGWWVLRGYLLVVVPAAFGVLGLDLRSAPFVTLLGSDLLGTLLLAAAVVASVRLGRGADRAPRVRRQLLAAGNLVLALLALAAMGDLRAVVGYDDQIVYAADTSYLQGPYGGISNIYAFDAEGRPLRDVQLFDQEGRPIDSLLLQAPDGTYAEPVRPLDEYGAEVLNVFPRTLQTEVYRPDGTYGPAVVPPPVITPRRLGDPSATATATIGSPSPSPSPSPAASPSPSPSQVPAPSPTS